MRFPGERMLPGGGMLPGHQLRQGRRCNEQAMMEVGVFPEIFHPAGVGTDTVVAWRKNISIQRKLSPGKPKCNRHGDPLYLMIAIVVQFNIQQSAPGGIGMRCSFEKIGFEPNGIPDSIIGFVEVKE